MAGRTGLIRGIAAVWVCAGALLYVLALQPERPVAPPPPPGPSSPVIDGCPVRPPGPVYDVALSLVGVEPWSRGHEAPLGQSRRDRFEGSQARCGGQWGEEVCDLQPCVVRLAVQHDLPGRVVWVDGRWWLRDPRSGARLSEVFEDSWFYLEPGAVRLPRDRAPLRVDDCSIFERVVMAPPTTFAERLDRLSLGWERVDFQMYVDGKIRGADFVDRRRASWVRYGGVGLPVERE